MTLFSPHQHHFKFNYTSYLFLNFSSELVMQSHHELQLAHKTLWIPFNWYFYDLSSRSL